MHMTQQKRYIYFIMVLEHDFVTHVHVHAPYDTKW